MKGKSENVTHRPAILGATLAILFTFQVHAADPDPEQLNFFVGSWSCAGHFIDNGAEIKSTMTFVWDAETKTLTVHHDDLAPNRYHALELWGVANAAKEFRNSIGDAYSGIRWYTSPGFAGESLSWTRSENGAPLERFIYTRKNPAQMTVEWWIVRPAGSLALGDTLDCRRTE
jgi:hypothetical protein